MTLLGYAEMTRPVPRRRRNAVPDIFQGISSEELAILRSTETLRLNGNSDNYATSDEALLEHLNESLMMSSGSAATPPISTSTTSTSSILTTSTSPSTSPIMGDSPMSTSTDSRHLTSICNSQRYRRRRNGLANIMDPQNTGRSCHGR